MSNCIASQDGAGSLVASVDFAFTIAAYFLPAVQRSGDMIYAVSLHLPDWVSDMRNQGAQYCRL